MRLIIILFLLQHCICLTAQQSTKGLLNSGDLSSQFFVLPSDVSIISNETIAPYYYHDEYTLGEICFPEGSCFQDIFFRVDLKRQLIEIRFENGAIRYAKTGQIERYTYLDRNYEKEIFLTYLKGSYLPSSNFRLIDSLGSSVLIEEIVVKNKAIENSNVPGLADSTKDVIELRCGLFHESNLISFRRTVSSIAEAFGLHKKELKKYVKMNSLDLKEDADLVHLIKYVIQHH